MGKYLVASSGNTLDSKVSGRFGHSNYFLVVDPQTMEFEAFPGIQPDESGEIIQPFIQQYINRGIEKVIVGNIGPSSFSEMRAAGFKIYLCRNMPILEAIKKVENGEVETLSTPTLPDSIHSARKSSEGGRGEMRGMGSGKGMGEGKGKGKGKGKGMGRGKGRNRL